MSRPFRAVKFRGLKVVAYYDSPMSINECVMYVDGEYVDNNLDIWDSYVDRHGSSRVRCYRTWEEAESVAWEWNEEHEEEEREEYRRKQEKERLKKERMDEHWRKVDELRAIRKAKLLHFINNIKKFLNRSL